MFSSMLLLVRMIGRCDIPHSTHHNNNASLQWQQKEILNQLAWTYLITGVHHRIIIITGYCLILKTQRASQASSNVHSCAKLQDVYIPPTLLLRHVVQLACPVLPSHSILSDTRTNFPPDHTWRSSGHHKSLARTEAMRSPLCKNWMNLPKLHTGTHALFSRSPCWNVACWERTCWLSRAHNWHDDDRYDIVAIPCGSGMGVFWNTRHWSELNYQFVSQCHWLRQKYVWCCYEQDFLPNSVWAMLG